MPIDNIGSTPAVPPPPYVERAESEAQAKSHNEPDLEISSLIEIDDPIREVSFGEVYNARWIQSLTPISEVMPPIAVRMIRAPYQFRQEQRSDQFRVSVAQKHSTGQRSHCSIFKYRK